MAEFIIIIGITTVIFQSIRIIPQVIKGFVTRSVRDVALSWEIIGSISSILWLWYGILLSDAPLIVGNSVNLACYLLLLVQKRLYH